MKRLRDPRQFSHLNSHRAQEDVPLNSTFEELQARLLTSHCTAAPAVLPSENAAPVTPAPSVASIFAKYLDDGGRNPQQWQEGSPESEILLCSKYDDSDLTLGCSTRPWVFGTSEVERELRALAGLVETGYLTAAEHLARKRVLEDHLPITSPLHPSYTAGRACSEPPSVRRSATEHTGGRAENAVRVFLSSTFVDMQGERDHLIKHVFPVLAAHCASRGVFFSVVDLRWGITADQANTGRTLGLCLSEIDRCRPFFVNMLGSRYGWMPDTIPEELYATYPFLSDVDVGHTSVTEMEVLHGALNARSPDALFYFRSSTASQSASEQEDGIRRVERLKGRIVSNGYKPVTYTSVEQLGAAVMKDLQQQIDVMYPALARAGLDSVQAELDAELRQHTTFAADRCRMYICRNELLKALHSYVDDSSQTQPLLVVGAPGLGKSSLVANWTAERVKNAKRGELVIQHYVGCSGNSADVTCLLTRVLRTLKKEFKLVEDVSTDASQLVRDLRRWILTLVPSSRSLVLVIDGLDHLTGWSNGKKEGFGGVLTWLPECFPADSRVRIVVATSTGHPSFDICASRGYPTAPLPVLTPEERSLLCVEHLKQFGKSLSATQLRMLVDAPQASHALYLRVILDELRVHGVYEEMDMLLQQLLSAQSVESLFQLVLDRLVRDYSDPTCRRPEGLVRAALSYIFVSRDGLSEEELLSLLDVPRLVLLPLLTAMQDMLICQAGLFTFAHEHLRAAVKSRFVDSEEVIRKYHCELADYFDFVDDPSADPHTPQRRAHELPYQLRCCERRYRLCTVLSDLRVFSCLYTGSKKFELKRYWLDLQDRYSVAQCYAQSFDEFVYGADQNEDDAALAASLARFLREMLQYEVAERLLRRALGILEAIAPNHRLVGKCCHWLAQVFWNQGLFDKAMPFCLRALEIRESLFGPDHPKVAKLLIPLGEMLTTPEPTRATEVFLRAKRICEAAYGDLHHRIARCLHGLGTLACDQGQYEQSIKYHLEATHVSEQVLGPRHPQLGVSWEVLGSNYKILGDNARAQVCFAKALSINVEVHGEICPQVASCCYWMWLVLNSEGTQTPEAIAYKARYVRIQAELDKLNIDVRQRVVD